VVDWDRLVREHGPLVAGTAWRILGHAADTEDVVQEVFLQAHRLRMSQPVRSWPALLRRLAATQSLYRLRQRKPALPLDGLDLPTPTAEPDEAVQCAELAERLRWAVAQLPAREGEVFCLRYFEEMPDQKIAEALDISGGAVRQALFKARAKLETLLLGDQISGERGALAPRGQ